MSSDNPLDPLAGSGGEASHEGPDPEVTPPVADEAPEAEPAPTVAPAPADRRVPAWLLAVLVLIAAVQVALVVAVLRTGNDVAAVTEEVAALSDGVSAAADEPAATPVTTTTEAPTTEDASLGAAVDVPVGFTEEGYPYRGDPDAAVTLIEYSDYGCPFCGRYTVESAPALIDEYVAGGDVQMIFRDFPLTALHPTAPAAHTAAWCSGQQSAELYWEMHDAIFARQSDWTGLPDPAEFLSGLAADAGVDMTAYAECVAGGGADEVIAAGVSEARSLGFSGTPSFVFVVDETGAEHPLVGAQPLGTFRGYVEALLAGEDPPGATPAPDETPEAQALPVWADPDTGLQPDPDRPGVNLAGDHYRGDLDAPVVVIEFSDFECPFCREHALGSQPVIDAALVETGDVLWVFKHLPLEIHPGALSAAVAAECAGDQGEFWEMHDLLFATVSRWAGEGIDTDAVLVDLASELDLDRGDFTACFDGRDGLQRVLADITDATGIISSTPSFVVIQGGRGSLLEGALPPDQFIEAIRARLDADA